MRRTIALVVVAFSFASSEPAARADVITTLADQNYYATTWGPATGGYSPTFGQTFTATATDSILLSMKFSIQYLSGNPILYRAFVIGWTGTTITGPELFSGPTSSLSSQDGYQTVTQTTGALALTPVQQYLAAFTTVGQGGTGGSATWGAVFPGTYAGGNFVTNSATTLAGLSSNWFQYDITDLAFELEFRTSAASVPAPPAVVLAGFGAGCVALRRYVGRRATAEPTLAATSIAPGARCRGGFPTGGN
jgi:hypothetical protein